MKALRIERRVERPGGTFTQLGIAVRVQIPEAEYEQVLVKWDNAPDDAHPEAADVWGDDITILGQFPGERAPRLQDWIGVIKERFAAALVSGHCPE